MGLSEFKVSNAKYNPYGSITELEIEIYEGPARNSTISVTKQGISIGRDPGNTFCIREDS